MTAVPIMAVYLTLAKRLDLHSLFSHTHKRQAHETMDQLTSLAVVIRYSENKMSYRLYLLLGLRKMERQKENQEPS